MSTATITPEQIEAGALAIYRARYGIGWAHDTEAMRDRCRDEARAAARAMGFVIEGGES